MRVRQTRRSTDGSRRSSLRAVFRLVAVAILALALAACGLTPRPAPIETAGSQTGTTAGTFNGGTQGRTDGDNTNGGFNTVADVSTVPDPAALADAVGESNDKNCEGDAIDADSAGCQEPDSETPDAGTVDEPDCESSSDVDHQPIDLGLYP